MLGRHTNALTLDTLDDGSANHSRHDRIFRIVFEVTSTQGIAVQVHTWSQDDVASIFECLIADGLSYLLHQFGVPRRGQTGTNGETGGIERLISTIAMRIDMHTGRSVSHYRSRNAQSVDGYRDTSSASHQFLLMTQHCS